MFLDPRSGNGTNDGDNNNNINSNNDNNHDGNNDGNDHSPSPQLRNRQTEATRHTGWARPGGESNEREVPASDHPIGNGATTAATSVASTEGDMKGVVGPFWYEGNL